MYDVELDEMIHDLCEVLHDVEWWQSSDISEDDYRKTAKKFKDKWLGKRDEQYKDALIKCLDETKRKIGNL